MNKNRKIVAFICAMAMILSVFTGFTVVNAEEPTRGFVFDNIQQSKDGKTITMDIKYQGYELGLSSFTIYADVPSAVTAIKTTSKFAGAVDDYSNGVYALTYAGSSNATTEGSVVANLELTFDAPLAEDAVLALKDTTAASAMNADESDYQYDDTIAAGTMLASTVTLPKYVDPDATPIPTPVAPIATRAPKPTKAPVATENPDVPSTPTLKPEVPVTRGFEFKNVVIEGTKVTMDIVYVGYPLGLSSFTIYADVPSVVTAIKTTPKFAGSVDDYSNGVYALHTQVHQMQQQKVQLLLILN